MDASAPCFRVAPAPRRSGSHRLRKRPYAAPACRAKARSLRDLPARTLAGEVPTIREIRTRPDDEIVERLTKVRGVGRWTAEMFLIFGLGRADVLPVDDYALRKGFASWYLWRVAESPPR